MLTNMVPGQYRKVSVATVDVPLTPAALTAHFRGREVYRHTQYVVARDRDGHTAVVQVAKASQAPLFSPVTEVRMLALPDECAYVKAPDVDTGLASALAGVARTRTEARCVVVEGRYDHVNFILDPQPVRLRVADVVPPQPAKLIDQAARVLEVAEELPPVELAPEVVDMADLARQKPADHYLLPCRASGFQLEGAKVSFLDERPARGDWTLIGCARSRRIHEWFYGELPAQTVEMCPRRLFSDDAGPVLTKCCLLEDHNETDGAKLVVPWGASLALVREALRDLASAAGPPWSPA